MMVNKKFQTELCPPLIVDINEQSARKQNVFLVRALRIRTRVSRANRYNTNN